ncbi:MULTISPECIES: DUF4845 domain-containing protein [unclassified Moraxella]|uniref:DUF4845 domain-containing protein n=1 Tax=unclassified Moraxella TaxID=2685852 RepID=UPI003AF97761
MNLPSQQRGASVSGIVILIVLIVVCGKIGMGIIPAQIGHYQLKKSVAWELKKSNDNKETDKQFLNNLMSQWNINGYTQKPEEVIEVVDNMPGAMSVKLNYSEVNNFFGNVDIVNRFEDTITAEDAKLAKQ